MGRDEKSGPATERGLSILLLNQCWLVDELRALGHRVVTAGWYSNSYDVHFRVPLVTVAELERQLPSGFVPDCIVYYDDSAPVGVIGLEKLSIPCVYYSVDAHHHSYWQRYFGAIFDLVLVAQKDYMPEFLRFNSNVRWFPLWASRMIEPEEPKTIGACFRGNLDPKWHPHRVEFFDALRTKVDIDADFGAYEEAYPKAKIVVNEAVNNDVNFRIFEAMACGAMLITPEVGNGLSDLFQPGVDLITYPAHDSDTAAMQIRHFMENEEARRKIAETGRAKVLNLHSPAARAKELSDSLLALSVRPKPIKFSAIALSYLICSKIYRKVSDMLGDRILRQAAESFIQAIGEDSWPNQEYENGVVICVRYLRERGYEEEARQLLREIWESNKSISLVAFYHMDQLMQDGRLDEVRQVAAVLSPDVQRLIDHVPSVIHEARERLLRHAPLG